MEEKINRHLTGLKDPEDRKILMEIMDRLLAKTHEHSEQMYADLEKRIFDETGCQQDSYDIYTNLVKKDAYDRFNSFMHPILSTDVESESCDAAKLAKCIEDKQKTRLFNVFLEMDFIEMEELLEKGYSFGGSVETQSGEYKASFSLQRNTKYQDQVEKLYGAFMDTDIEWKTVNSAYMTKMAEVFLEGCESGIKEGETISKISVDFQEYEKYVRYDVVPVWNVSEIEIAGSGFPMPCEDRVNYEHMVSLEEEGLENGYLVQGEGVVSSTRRGSNMAISSGESDARSWELVKISKPSGAKVQKYEYQTLSNSQSASFVQKIASRKRAIRTKAELRRLVNSFGLSDHIEFREAGIAYGDETTNETYSMNAFIIDEIRTTDHQKKLILYFARQHGDSFIARDMLSFIVSQIQLYYPEYRCEGRLI